MDTEQISQLSLMLLPPEILERILTNLNAEQLALVSAVCRTINTNAEFVALTRGVHSDDDPTIRYTVGRAPYLASFEGITDRSYSGHGALELLSHLPSAVLARYTDAILHIMRNGENVQVKSRAIETLLKLDKGVLEQYSTEFINMITYENQIDQINEIVLKILLKIDPSLVVDIMLHNDYGEIKLTALWIMGSLRRDALQDYTVHITSMLTDANTYPNMVMTAMNILCKIDPEIVIRFITGHDEAHFLLASYALNQIGEREVQLYAERFARMLDDEQYAHVHTALIQVLSKLKFNPTELAKYAEAFKRNLTNPDASVRQCATSALQGLESTTLTQYAKFVETNLDYESVGVRVAAVITLGKLESNVLATYADHIKKLLTDQNDGVKVRALETLGNLEYDELEKYYADIWKLALDDPNRRVREQAILTLDKIEMPRRRIEEMNRRNRQRTH